MPAFSFDPTTGRYRDVQGKLVAQSRIRAALDKVLGEQAVEARNLTAMLADGKVTLADWQRLMMHNVKTTHLVAATIPSGGWANMTQSDFGWAGQRIRTQYNYLRGFAADIASGKQALTPSALARAELYARAGRATHRAGERRKALARGEEQEKNVLGAADHCAGCLKEASRGWVALRTLSAPGTRECRVNCHCYLIYRAKPTRQAA